MMTVRPKLKNRLVALMLTVVVVAGCGGEGEGGGKPVSQGESDNIACLVLFEGDDSPMSVASNLVDKIRDDRASMDKANADDVVALAKRFRAPMTAASAGMSTLLEGIASELDRLTTYLIDTQIGPGATFVPDFRNFRAYSAQLTTLCQKDGS